MGMSWPPFEKTNVNRRVLKRNHKCNRKYVSCNYGGYSAFHSTVMRASLIVLAKWMRIRILSMLFLFLVVFQWEGFVARSSFRGQSLHNRWMLTRIMVTLASKGDTVMTIQPLFRAIILVCSSQC